MRLTQNFHITAIAIAATLAVLVPVAYAGGTYNAYAPPNAFGGWTQVGAHIGEVNYEISATPVGKTVIVGEVMYFKYANQPAVIEPFNPLLGIRIHTCKCYATVKVRFKGTPLGSAVKVSVKP